MLSLSLHQKVKNGKVKTKLQTVISFTTFNGLFYVANNKKADSNKNKILE